MRPRVDETRTFILAHLALLCVVLCVVLVGFGRTFCLRPLFFDHALSVMLKWHGVMLRRVGSAK